MRKRSKSTNGEGAARPNGHPTAVDGAWLAGLLSPKEAIAFSLLGRGHSMQEIADSLGCRYFTATTHLKRIRKKLQVPNQRQLLIAAIRHEAGLSQ